MVNELKVFENVELGLKVRAIQNEDGSISINAEDTARGFGWYKTENKNGRVYSTVRWSTINGYCKEFGFDNKLAKDDFIPESLFYLLGMKANNATAQKFQTWLAVDIIPQIRQTGGYIPVSEEEDDEQFLARALVVAQKTLEKKAIIIKQQKEKLEYQEPLVQLALKRLDKDGLISITDANKTFELKRGVMTRWAKNNGYIHKTQTEVNEKGEKYFKVYDNGGYKAIGVTEDGIRLINDSLDEIIHN